MKIGIILLALLPMLIVSGADGIDCSISGGNGGHSYGYGNHIEAGNGVGVSGHFSTNGDNFAGNCEFKGDGRLNIDETKRDHAGDSVTLTAKGFLLPGAHYKQSWNGEHTSGPITGIQELSGTVSKTIECSSKAVNRNGLVARVSAGGCEGTIDIKQGATASESTADAWQGINWEDGKNIELNAVTFDGLDGEADSSVTINHGSLVNYNSEAQASKVPGYIDLYAIHGAFNIVDKKVNPLGSISGDIICSEGSTTSETGLSASYYATIQGKDKKPAVEGRFDWGTETTSNGWVIAAPLESPLVWGGIPGDITLSASKISSHSEATGKIPQDSKDCNVNVKNWVNGHGFAQSSEAGVNPKP